ncbi:hypothetical protein [Hoeflea sp. TYP-13]|uniref:hypothetical protein n=1 Tax=Hoeflea sp. TYP-13 TaxID=3230023 RepID=UPI0034C5D6C2
MSMDPVTEAIAHFIGVFNLIVEQQRGRIDYDEFSAQLKEAREDPELHDVSVKIMAPHKLEDFEPHVNYMPKPVDLEEVFIPVLSNEFFQLPFSEIGEYYELLQPHYFIAPHFSFARFSFEFVVPPANSIAVLSQQTNRLTDNDYLNMPEVEVETIAVEKLKAGQDWLEKSAAELDPIGYLGMPGSEEAIGEIIDQAVSAMDDAAGQAGSNLVATGEDMIGVHVNGTVADEAPKLSDYLKQEEEEEEETEGVSYMAGEGEIQPVPLLDLDAGGNKLANEAYIASVWVDAPVFAAMGNAVSLNIISQTNVWYDVDSIAGAFSGLHDPLAAATKAFNIASFTIESTSTDAEDGAVSGGFPEFWSVTRMEGNVVLLNWMEQINLVSDNDVTVLSSSGSEAYLQIGENTAFNGFSLVELGFHYDLIVIGGNIYNANIISQSNVLFDSDYVSALGEFGTSWNGQLSTNGNLLWNQASIKTIGETTYEAMTDAYAQTAQKLKDGNDTITNGVLTDALFAGTGALSVLYIEGSLLDLQYISQKNVLGDADQIAMVASGLAGDTQTQWQLDAGGNELINIASIVDVGVDSTVYVDGEVYSEAFLYQAELVSDDPLAAAGDPEALAGEAVLFLADGMLDPEGQQQEESVIKPVEPQDPGQADVMQTMLA